MNARAEEYGLKDGKSLMMCLATVFKRHDQTLGEFNNECKLLTIEDKEWFRRQFKIEFDIEPGTPPASAV